MPVFFAVIGTPLYDFAAGCVLAANVYLMIRGGKNYLKGRKKQPIRVYPTETVKKCPNAAAFRILARAKLFGGFIGTY